MDYYRDPIHNYLAYTVSENENEITEKTLISSRWIQRLRRIFQLQYAWLVYPGAKHSRFLHVMGVMNLAGKLKVIYGIHMWRLTESIQSLVKTMLSRHAAWRDYYMM